MGDAKFARHKEGEYAVGESVYLSVQDLAQMFGVPVATVYGWNHRGTGPRRISVGKHVRYRASDVAEWVERQSDPRPAA